MACKDHALKLTAHGGTGLACHLRLTTPSGLLASALRLMENMITSCCLPRPVRVIRKVKAGGPWLQRNIYCWAGKRWSHFLLHLRQDVLPCLLNQAAQLLPRDDPAKSVRPTTHRNLLAAKKGWMGMRCTAAVLGLSLCG